MMNGRTDAIYLALLLAVFAFAYSMSTSMSTSNRPAEEIDGARRLALEAPAPAVDLEIELDFPFPYEYARLQRPSAPKLRLSENMESVLVEVRSALLESATPIEEQRGEELAAVLE